MITYKLRNTSVAKLYISYLLDNGFCFEVIPWTSGIEISVPVRANSPQSDWIAS